MHEAMPTAVEMEYVLSLRRAADFFTQRGGMYTWSLFAGTGLSAKLMVIVEDFFYAHYNIALCSRIAVLSEKKESKLAFCWRNIQMPRSFLTMCAILGRQLCRTARRSHPSV